jgi:hypothetical protein
VRSSSLGAIAPEYFPDKVRSLKCPAQGGDFCKVRLFARLDILCSPTPGRFIGRGTNRADSIDVASVRPHEDPEGSGSQAERDADKQRLLLLIYWSRSAPKAMLSGLIHVWRPVARSERPSTGLQCQECVRFKLPGTRPASTIFARGGVHPYPVSKFLRLNDLRTNACCKFLCPLNLGSRIVSAKDLAANCCASQGSGRTNLPGIAS